MSPLPKKKKTLEELAALRESLGISSDGPPADAPGVMGHDPIAPPEESPRDQPPIEAMALPEERFAPRKPAEPDEMPELESSNESLDEEKAVILKTPETSVVKAKPVRSLRKSESLPVDKPKKVVSNNSGKLPTRRHREGERIPLEKPTKPVSAGGGELPTRKHSDRELARLRHTPEPGAEAPAVNMADRKVGWLGLAGVYGFGVLLMFLAGLGGVAARAARFDLPFDWLKDAVVLPNFTMIVYAIMAGGVAVMLVGAAWIFFKKPISQHHAAILTIIAVLVLVFGTLYFFPELHGA